MSYRNCLQVVSVMLAGCICIASNAVADDIIPPKTYATTPGGLNIADGSLVYSVTDLSIGSLTLTRHYRSMNGPSGQEQPNNPPFGVSFSHNFDIYYAPNPSPYAHSAKYPIIHIGQSASGMYSGSGPVYTPNNKDAEKGRLESVSGKFVYTDSSGTIYTFSATVEAKGLPMLSSASRMIERIDFPDGRRQDFSYDTNDNLKLVEDSSGYAFVFDYNGSGDITAACAFNRAETYVNASSTCASADLKTTYTYSSGKLNTATDVLNNTTTYTHDTHGLTCIKPPTFSQCRMSMTNSNKGRIETQTLLDGGSWGIAGDNPEDTMRADATAPENGSNEGYVTNPAGGTTYIDFTLSSPYWMRDALNRDTSYRFSGGAKYNDPNNPAKAQGTFLDEATYPEGNKYTAEYNGPFKAVTKETVTAKPGSGLDPLVKIYGYTTSCTVSPGTYQNCAKPTSVIDPNTNQTDYTYKSHGGIESEMLPAPELGDPRPLKIYTYTQKYAYVKNSSGTLVPAATQIWVINTETSCQTTTTSNPPVCDSAPQMVTTYEYGADNSANNLRVKGTVVTATGETASLRTCFRYDNQGNEISKTTPGAGLSSCPASTTSSTAGAYTWGTRYDKMRRVTGTMSPDPDGTGGPINYAAIRNTYNNAGQLTRVETGELSTWPDEDTAPTGWSTSFTLFKQVDTSYNGQHQKTLEIVSANSTNHAATQYNYDAAGRLKCTAQRMNPATYGSLPDACSLATAGNFGKDRITRNVYDNAGQVTKVQRAYGTVLQQDYQTNTYTDNGKLATVTDANGNTSKMTYDGHDRLEQLNFPSKTTPGAWSATDYEHYDFDPNGNRTLLRKRDSQTINYEYDALNRMTEKNLPNTTTGDVYYKYDFRGLQEKARFGSLSGAGITTAYDGFGRLETGTNNTGGTARTLTYEFDAEGNRTRLTFPDDEYFEFEYDGLNRMKGILESGTTSVTSIVYNERGRRKDLTGGVATAYTYDDIDRLASIDHDLNGTSDDVTYTFSSYNPASQVLAQSRDNDDYGYSDLSIAYTTYAANGLNQYTDVGGDSPTHDANGNMSSDGATPATNYGYDVENRLISVTGASSALMDYDPMGRLFGVSAGSNTTDFLYDGDALVAEYDNSGNLLRRYVHGPGVDEPLLWYEGSNLNTRQHLRSNHLGSIVAVTNASGVSQTTNTFDEYGKRGSYNDGRFQYTGQILIPEIGLYHYKARMYSAELGRFLQTDPIGYEDQMNLYAYVGNDPLNMSDPTGRESVGETIDRKATDAAEGGDSAATYGWALAGVAWNAFGAEGVSQVADKGADAGVGDKGGALLEVAGVIPGVKPASTAVKTATKSVANVVVSSGPQASANRAKNVEKGVAESDLGPSGKPKIHVKKHPTRKRAQDSARDRSRRGGSPKEHANPTKGDSHFHPDGSNSREHHSYPGKGFPKNDKY